METSIQCDMEMHDALLEIDKSIVNINAISRDMRCVEIISKLMKDYPSQEALDFITERFSLEAEFSKGVDDAKSTSSPTLSGKGSTKAGKDGNNDNKANGATGSGANNAMANLYGGLKEKLKLGWQAASGALKNGWFALRKFCKQKEIELANKINEMADDATYQVSGVCVNIGHVQLTPVLAQIDGAKSKEDIEKIVSSWQQRLNASVQKDVVTMSKQDFVGKLINPYRAAMKRIETMEEKSASNNFEAAAQKANATGNGEVAQLLALQRDAKTNVQKTFMKFVYGNVNKLLGIATQRFGAGTQGAQQGGQTQEQTNTQTQTKTETAKA